MSKQLDIDLDRVYAGDRVEKAGWLPSRGVQRKATRGAHCEQRVTRELGQEGCGCGGMRPGSGATLRRRPAGG